MIEVQLDFTRPKLYHDSSRFNQGQLLLEKILPILLWEEDDRIFLYSMIMSCNSTQGYYVEEF